MVDESIKLIVKKSTIPGGGIARIHEKYLSNLSIQSGENVVVTFKDKSIIIKVFSDSLIGNRDIRLRENDIKKLGVRKTETVEITRLIPITESIKEKYMKIINIKIINIKKFLRKHPS